MYVIGSSNLQHETNKNTIAILTLVPNITITSRKINSRAIFSSESVYL